MNSDNKQTLSSLYQKLEDKNTEIADLKSKHSRMLIESNSKLQSQFDLEISQANKKNEQEIEILKNEKDEKDEKIRELNERSERMENEK